MKAQIDIQSFWLAFQGPGNDWPLALCDCRTINYSTDAVEANLRYNNNGKDIESTRFYYSSEHKWYYFKDLGSDEILMFRQTDSSLEGGGSELFFINIWQRLTGK